MRKVLKLAALMLCLAAFVCGTAEAKTIKYKKAENYFVRNDYKAYGLKKFTTQAEFDRCFGMATTMGRNGRPTEIDFSRSFVIANILPETDYSTEVSPAGVSTGDDNSLVVRSSVKRGEKQSYTQRPFYMIVVSRKYVDRQLRNGSKICTMAGGKCTKANANCGKAGAICSKANANCGKAKGKCGKCCGDN